MRGSTTRDRSHCTWLQSVAQPNSQRLECSRFARIYGESLQCRRQLPALRKSDSQQRQRRCNPCARLGNCDQIEITRGGIVVCGKIVSVGADDRSLSQSRKLTTDGSRVDQDISRPIGKIQPCRCYRERELRTAESCCARDYELIPVYRPGAEGIGVEGTSASQRQGSSVQRAHSARGPGSSFRAGVDYSSPGCRYSTVYRTRATEGAAAIHRNGRARSRASIYEQRAAVERGRAGVSIGASEGPCPRPTLGQAATSCANNATDGTIPAAS